MNIVTKIFFWIGMLFAGGLLADHFLGTRFTDTRKPIDYVCIGSGTYGQNVKHTLSFKPDKMMHIPLKDKAGQVLNWSLTIDGNRTYLPVHFNYDDDEKQRIYELNSTHAEINDDLIKWTDFNVTKPYWSDNFIKGKKELMPKTQIEHYITINRVSGDFIEETFSREWAENERNDKTSKSYMSGRCERASRI